MENNENNFDMNEEKNEVTPEQAPETPVAPEAPAPEAPKAAQAAPAAGADEGKGFSIAALVLGILGIVIAWVPLVSVFAFICAILGIIFGVKGKKMSAAVYGKPSGMATAGFVLGIIGVAFATLALIVVGCSVGCAACLGTGAGALSELDGLY